MVGSRGSLSFGPSSLIKLRAALTTRAEFVKREKVFEFATFVIKPHVCLIKPIN